MTNTSTITRIEETGADNLDMHDDEIESARGELVSVSWPGAVGDLERPPRFRSLPPKYRTRWSLYSNAFQQCARVDN
jgi:hypothetical protein